MYLRRDFIALSLLLASSPSWSQSWPSKPVKIIDPFTPGGSSDVLARSIIPNLEKSLGQSFYIEYVPGAGGTIGADRVAKMDNDGYSLLMGHIGTMAVAPHIYKNLPYNPLTDFEPVAWIGNVSNILALHPSLPVNNFNEFIAYVKDNPGKLNYSSGGNGSAAHLVMEYLKIECGIEINHIPYKGTAPAINDLLGGQVQAVFTGAPSLLPFIKNGRLKGIAISSAQRISSATEIPTVSELGFPKFEADQWYGLFAPKGLNIEIAERLNRSVNKSLKEEEVSQKLLAAGAIPVPVSREHFRKHVNNEFNRWKTVINKASIKI